MPLKVLKVLGGAFVNGVQKIVRTPGKVLRMMARDIRTIPRFLIALAGVLWRMFTGVFS